MYSELFIRLIGDLSQSYRVVIVGGGPVAAGVALVWIVVLGYLGRIAVYAFILVLFWGKKMGWEDEPILVIL